jgi:Glucose / Sorbosone dehydrogenase
MRKYWVHSTQAVSTLAMLVLIFAALGTLVAQSPEPKPAFAGQTKAPAAAPSAPFQTQIVTERLNAPWSLAFLPDGTFLVTENGGSMRVVKADGSVSDPIEGTPGADHPVSCEVRIKHHLMQSFRAYRPQTSPISRRRWANPRAPGRWRICTRRSGRHRCRSGER